MKALTIRQPWASLIALGVKRIETRSWSTRYCGPIAIHAGKRLIGCEEADLSLRHLGHLTPPRGAIVATAVLTDVVPIIDGEEADDIEWVDLPYPRIETRVSGGDFPDGWADLYHATHGNPIDPETGLTIIDQLPFGDFAPGRFAWLLDDVKPTTDRCPGCWGDGDVDDKGNPAWLENPCPTCGRRGRCEPVPANGRQGLWEWIP